MVPHLKLVPVPHTVTKLSPSPPSPSSTFGLLKLIELISGDIPSWSWSPISSWSQSPRTVTKLSPSPPVLRLRSVYSNSSSLYQVTFRAGRGPPSQAGPSPPYCHQAVTKSPQSFVYVRSTQTHRAYIRSPSLFGNYAGSSSPPRKTWPSPRLSPQGCTQPRASPSPGLWLVGH